MRPKEIPAKCLFFGVWGRFDDKRGKVEGGGHYLYAPGGRSFWNDTLSVVGDCHIDGALAPRKVRMGTYTWYRLEVPSRYVWQAMGEDQETRQRIRYDSEELPQGTFLFHILPNGFSAIQWWDRCQGDERGACNSTIMLNGVHTAAEVLAAGKEHFPQVFENLERAGVKLVDVTDYPKSNISPEQHSDFDMYAESSPGFKQS